jgi:hypothetical protein
VDRHGVALLRGIVPELEAGKRSNSSRARSRLIFLSVSAVTATEWQVNTGTRTVVGITARSGTFRILRVSLTSLISSPV